MKVEKVYKSIMKKAENYRLLLHGFSPSTFETTPLIGGWSYSEVYSHIFDSSLLSVMAINNCIREKGKIKPTGLLVKFVLFLGVFPPGRKFKAPSKIAARVKKMSIANAQQIITNFELQLAQVFPKIKNANPKIKAKHPVIGYLNAKQWLRFIEIHLKHHYKQLKRIENSFKQQS